CYPRPECGAAVSLSTARRGADSVVGQEEGGSRMEGRVRWFAEVIGAGLDKGLINPRDILDHATPNVLAENVPRDTIAALLRASLAAPKMSPASVIETVTPAVLATHVPHPTL